MKTKNVFTLIAALGILALLPLLANGQADSALAGDQPPGTYPPTVDGLLDPAYDYVGRTADPNTPGKLYRYFDDPLGDDPYCYYALVVDREYNDNVFGPYEGTPLDGWSNHTFRHLETSDSAYFTGAVPGCEFNLDYLDREGDPAVWCSGMCGDADLMVPAGCTEIDVATSMEYNATYSGWGEDYFDATAPVLDGKWWVSPPLDYNCVSDDYYEWEMIYEFSVPMPAGGCGTLAVSNSHNSPAKVDQQTPGLGKIGNYVWWDDDCDGCQEPGTPGCSGPDTCDENLCNCGLGGVCMSLFKLQADGTTWLQVATTHTDRCGEYWFTNLEAGTYYVDTGNQCVPSGMCHTLGDCSCNNGSMTDPENPGDPPIPLCEGFQTSGVGEPIILPAEGIFPSADFGYDNTPTAVKLAWFLARGRIQSIVLGWETLTEFDNLGFNVYRAEEISGPKTRLNDALIPSNVPPGSPFGAVYKYRDTNVAAGVTYYYWLEDVDIYGKTSLNGPARARVRRLDLEAAR